jgi:hypothetical protein
MMDTNRLPILQYKPKDQRRDGGTISF